MATAYLINPELGVVFSFAWHRVTLDAVLAFRKQLVADPLFHREYRQFLDFSRVTEMALSAEEIFKLSQQPVFKPEAARLVVAPVNLHYGLSRMFQSYNPGQNITLFHTLNKALIALGVSMEAYTSVCRELGLSVDSKAVDANARRPALARHGTPVAPVLREVESADLDYFFAQQLDPEANWMAAFVAKDPTDRDAFDAHWSRILKAPGIINRTLVAGGEVAGHIACFPEGDHLEVTYWIGKAFWGHGLASVALKALLQLVKERPLHARAASDNLPSLRVLRKCGFVVVGTDRGFANGRGMEIEETLLRLD